MNEVYENMPVLFDMKGKVRFLLKDTYISFYDGGTTVSGGSSANTSGITTTRYYASPVDIKLYYNTAIYEYTKGTIVHELGHAWDTYYGAATRDYNNNKIRQRADVIELYNTHLEEQSGERPMRDYFYSVIEEFWADSVAFYYGDEFGRVDNAERMKNTPEYRPPTDDINDMVEKYICIAENNYNEEAECS